MWLVRQKTLDSPQLTSWGRISQVHRVVTSLKTLQDFWCDNTAPKNTGTLSSLHLTPSQYKTPTLGTAKEEETGPTFKGVRALAHKPAYPKNIRKTNPIQDPKGRTT